MRGLCAFIAGSCPVFIRSRGVSNCSISLSQVLPIVAFQAWFQVNTLGETLVKQDVDVPPLIDSRFKLSVNPLDQY